MWWQEDKTTEAVTEKRLPKPSRASVLNVKTQEQKNTRRRWLIIVSGALLATIAAGTLIFLGLQTANRLIFSENDEFIIKHYDIASDGRLRPWHIREYAGLEDGLNLFAIDLGQVKKDLESVPLIEQAEVQRRLPDKLIIRTKERVAIARLALLDRNSLPMAIDRHGYVLGPGSVSPLLPLIVGINQKGIRPGTILQRPEIIETLKFLDLCDSTKRGVLFKVYSVGVQDPDLIEVRLSTGEQILFGYNQMPQRVAKVSAILHANRKLGRKPVLIDATGEKNYPVAY